MTTLDAEYSAPVCVSLHVAMSPGTQSYMLPRGAGQPALWRSRGDRQRAHRPELLGAEIFGKKAHRVRVVLARSGLIHLGGGDPPIEESAECVLGAWGEALLLESVEFLATSRVVRPLASLYRCFLRTEPGNSILSSR